MRTAPLFRTLPVGLAMVLMALAGCGKAPVPAPAVPVPVSPAVALVSGEAAPKAPAAARDAAQIVKLIPADALGFVVVNVRDLWNSPEG